MIVSIPAAKEADAQHGIHSNENLFIGGTDIATSAVNYAGSHDGAFKNIVKVDDRKRIPVIPGIEKYEISGGEVILYLDEMSGSDSFEVEYLLKARLEGKITMPKAEVYEYYNPDNRAYSKQEKITVNKS